MNYGVLSYEEFLEREKKYDGTGKCYCYDCDKPALYEGGDARCWCPMCEEHSSMPARYRTYLRGFKIAIKRELFNMDAYLRVKAQREKLENKIKEALEDGPKSGETE